MTFYTHTGDYKLCMKTVNPVTREVEFQKKDYTKRFSSKSIRRVREDEGRWREGSSFYNIKRDGGCHVAIGYENMGS